MATDPRIGTTIGRYRIDEAVGKGGMGVVYRGTQESLERSVAIKMLPTHLAEGSEMMQRFRQEALAIARLTHENIVHVYDIEEADGTLFLIMEYIDGPSVRDVLAHGPLAVAHAIDIGISVARALGMAHQHGVIHRDVKPANVMINRAGTVKLMDFGVAQVSGATFQTQTGMVLGTPYAMAPEQLQEARVSPQSDFYSLGVLLYECLTGEPVFDGHDAMSVAFKHVNEEPRPLSDLESSVPAELEGVVLRALAKDPEDRFEDSAAFETALIEAAYDAGLGADIRFASRSSTNRPSEGSLKTMVTSGTTRAGGETSSATGPRVTTVAALTSTFVRFDENLRGWLSKRSPESVRGVWARRGAGLLSIVGLLASLGVGLVAAMGGPGDTPVATPDESALEATNVEPVADDAANTPEEPVRVTAALDDVEPEPVAPRSADVPSETAVQSRDHDREPERQPSIVAASPPAQRAEPTASKPQPPVLRSATAASPGPVSSLAPATEESAEESSDRAARLATPALIPPAPATTPSDATPTTDRIVAPPDVEFVEEYACRSYMEFHVDPEEALITVNGTLLGEADDWDGSGGGDEYRPEPGRYEVMITHPKYPTIWVLAFMDPEAEKKKCDIDPEMEDYE